MSPTSASTASMRASERVARARAEGRSWLFEVQYYTVVSETIARHALAT